MTGKRKITSILAAAAAIPLCLISAIIIFRPADPHDKERKQPGLPAEAAQSAQFPAPQPASHPSAPALVDQAPAAPAPTRMSAKVGVVDMNRVFQGYYKTRQLERKINEDRGKAKKEMDTRTEKYRSLSGRLTEIDKLLKDRLVSEQLKQQKYREGQSLMEEANRMAREIQEFALRRERQLQDAADRLKRELVKEIVAQVRETSKRDNFDFVFDRSGLGIAGTPLLPASRSAADLSSALIGELNRHAPPEDASTTEGIPPATDTALTPTSAVVH